MPKLQGLFGVSAGEIIDAVKYVLVQLYNLKFNTTIHLTDRLQSGFGSVFTSESFQNFCLDNKFKSTLAAPKHLEMNSIVERTFQSLTSI